MKRPLSESKLREKSQHCRGCTENFYNGNNPLGVQFCWSLPSARMVKRVRVSIDQRPPWHRDEVKCFNCRHERRVVLMTPENFDANMRAYRDSVAREARQADALADCAYCHRPIAPDDAVDDTGTMHFEPCAGADRQAQEDRLVDHARDAEMMRTDTNQRGE